MLKATLRNLAAHKFRLALTVLSVVLGVALVAGTLVFTDTLRKTFDDLFAQTSADVQVSPKQVFTAANAPMSVDTVPAQVLDTVRSVQGVEKAEGGIFVDGVQVVGPNGKLIGSTGAPSFGVNWSDDKQLSPLRLVTGRGPTAEGQIAIDSQTADKAKAHVGDHLRVLLPEGAPIDPEIVGIFRFGTTGNLAGASLTAFDTATAQKLFLQSDDAFTQVAASGKSGVSQQELANRVKQAVGPDYKVQTGQQAADELTKQIDQALSFINIFLLVFAIIALVVGSFIIFNTFSMLVAQRTRELALLRAVGARRRQVTRSVLLEAVITGFIGATLGLLLGVLLAMGIRGLFGVLGILDIPSGGLVVKPGTVIWAYVIGVVVTVLAAFIPARRASRVSPVAAMRADLTTPPRSLRLRTIIGVVFCAAGLAVGFLSLSGSGGSAAKNVGLAAGLLLIGSIVIAAPIAQPVVRWLGAPLRRPFPVTGKLAVRNASRNSRRTAATASALTIMLALVTAIGVIAASTRASVNRVIDSVIKADYTVTNPSFLGFSPTVAQSISQVQGVDTVSQVRFGVALVKGKTTQPVGVDPKTIGDVLSFTFTSGSFSDLDDAGVVVDSQLANSQSYKLGDTVTFTFMNGQKKSLKVQGVYKTSGFFTGYVVTQRLLKSAGAPERDFTVYVKTAPGANQGAVRNGIDAATAAYPNVQVQDQTEFKGQVRSQVNQLLFLIYGLLVIAAIIAALGIVNTLLLSVIERTREIGLLRAVGTSRRQIRQTVTVESVLIAAFGALIGIGLGLLCGWWLQHAVRKQGIDVLAIPWLQIVIFMVIALTVGFLAALWPARRGARLDVLQAIATE